MAPMPVLSLKALESGDYFRLWDNYAADHIAFRDTLVAVSKRISSWQGYTGREQAEIVASRANNTGEAMTAEPPNSSDPPPQAPQNSEPPAAAAPPKEADKPGENAPPRPDEKGRVHGKVLITGDRAMNLFTYDPAAGKAYADAVNRIREVLTSGPEPLERTAVLLAPTAAEFVRSPKWKALSSSQQEAFGSVYRQLNGQITTIDALAALREHAGEPLHFRTDHHWTATGAYYAYAAYVKAIGLTPIPLSSYATEKVHGFLGSLYSATLNRRLAEQPDTIVLYKPAVKHEYVVHYSGPLRMPLLDMSHAGKKNKYRIFLSGDRPWGRITTESDGPRLAVIKDSYGNALIPFLLPHFSEIYVIDPRQFNRPLDAFVREHKIRELLFVNNAEVTMESSFAEQLRRILGSAAH
ncbi:hypothetical protein LJK88_23140 [Paenibacillus sp. P26]|nr:hypothetical protein LJK88_23140 [Paenibacillus sp. P26]